MPPLSQLLSVSALSSLPMVLVHPRTKWRGGGQAAVWGELTTVPEGSSASPDLRNPPLDLPLQGGH